METLNKAAFEYAKQLIQQGRVNRDADWESRKPTPESENEYLAANNNNFNTYGKWFLGINESANPNTKERYSFPIGNFKTIIRTGIIAAEQRAAQYKHSDIQVAAKELLNMIG